MAEQCNRYEIIVFGDPEAGIWCDVCLLPSVLRFKLIGMSGMKTLDFGAHDFCPDCQTFDGFVAKARSEIKERYRGS